MVVVKDEMLVVNYTTCLRPSELCNQTVGNVALSRQGSGASSGTPRPLPLEETKASKTKKFDGSAPLVGHFSVPVLTGMVCNLTGFQSLGVSCTEFSNMLNVKAEMVDFSFL